MISRFSHVLFIFILFPVHPVHFSGKSACRNCHKCRKLITPTLHLTPFAQPQAPRLTFLTREAPSSSDRLSPQWQVYTSHVTIQYTKACVASNPADSRKTGRGSSPRAGREAGGRPLQLRTEGGAAGQGRTAAPPASASGSLGGNTRVSER